MIKAILSAIGCVFSVAFVWYLVMVGLPSCAWASAQSNNDMMISCLDNQGYNRDLPVEERFANFNFNEAADCYFKTKYETVHSPQDERRRTFLKSNPHYRGPDYRWEERAHYKCEDIKGSGITGTITICREPYYRGGYRID